MSQTENNAAINAKLCNNIWEKSDPTMKRQYKLINMGKTGYIDYLDLDDLEQDVVVGRDQGERKWIGMRVHIVAYKKGDIVNRESGVLVFHERYIGRHDFWVAAGATAWTGCFSPHDMDPKDMASFSKFCLGEVNAITVISPQEPSLIYIIEKYTP